MEQIRRFHHRAILVLLVIFMLGVTGCHNDDDEVKPEIVKLVESNLLFERSKQELQLAAGVAGFEELKPFLDYDIRVYEITYKTDYLGQEIIASGLVGFPDTNESIPMLSFQHGTIVKHSDAPTEDDYYPLLASMASAGYILLIPDYIGFGSSADLLHPYYRADLMATSVMDMMLAARELAVLEGFDFNRKAFLAGYSEGGYATMATHKAIEENGLEGIELVASAPAAGGYDVKGMQEYLFSQETYNEPYYLAYVALAYQTTYDWDQPLSDFFQEPYASGIPGYFDGSLSGSEINDMLTDTVANLVTPDFLTGIDTDPKYANIEAAFEENSLTGWAPHATMLMYHGTADNTVPYQNSVDTYESLLAAGASPNKVQLIPLDGATHSSGLVPYITDAIERFETLK